MELRAKARGNGFSLVRTAAFRWALAIAGSFALLSLLLFAFV
ncbi:hypothetical protein [Lichenibacterium minor]|nr:hypothetical protein [Lichenibacterium minor]